MSYSSTIKEELCRVDTEPGGCCARAELAAILCMNAPAGGGGARRIITENAAFARRAFNLLRGASCVPPGVSILKKRVLKKNVTYVINISSATQDGDVAGLRRLTLDFCCKKAALRGAFLAGGSIANPEKLYHLEIYCRRLAVARFLAELMSCFDLNPKLTERSDYHIVYIKDGEGIVDFLNAAGAHNALLSLENTRILKEMRNSVNRVVNCETANLEKTVTASMRQVANILYIEETAGFDTLPPGLRDIAALRAANRDVDLKELGQLLNPPIGKSGVNHRLRKLDAIACALRRNRGLVPRNSGK